ncbi:MAG: peptidase D-aminopeptidase [Clostridiales bacterium]|jgi:D-amino peptidase|nr:peptidase D-aminopeptidase [Clostridiales bacterium]
MKIYISADIEGISGVVNGSFTSQREYDYPRARKLMTDEVNAAVEGVKLAGADEILVNDSHGPMTNILIEDLDEDVRLISGSKKLLGMMEGIDSTFDGVLLIGYHGRHNSSGVLSHSYYGSVVTEIKINGNIVGESELNSMAAGYYGVPVVFVSGDDVLSGQVKEFNPDIETLIVKKAHSRYCAESIQPKLVHKLLKENVQKTLENNLKNIKPCKVEGKVELEIAFHNSGMAEATLFIPGVEMVAPNRVKYMAKDIIEAYKLRAALVTLASSTL